MKTTELQTNITFQIDDVEPATEPMETVKTHESVENILQHYKGDHKSMGGMLAMIAAFNGKVQLRDDQPVEACSDYLGDVVMGPQGAQQSLLHAIYLAYSQHRPLVLSPDMFWLTILQGFAHHVTVHHEKLRPYLTNSSEKIGLSVRRDDFIKGNPENTWEEVIESLLEQMEPHLQSGVVPQLRPKFSTTGPIETLAYNVAILDCMAPYFTYDLTCICGIPEVTLEGTVDDWKMLAARIKWLHERSELDLEWWTKHLLPIAENLVKASEGQADTEWWKRICKLRHAYGGSFVNGWMVNLVPYIRDSDTKLPTMVNRHLGIDSKITPDYEEWKADGMEGAIGMPTWEMPAGISVVPFEFHDEKSGQTYQMEFAAGFIGIKQNGLQLRPHIGWAVRDTHPLESALPKLKQFCTNPPVPEETVNQKEFGPFQGMADTVTRRFWSQCNGIKLPGLEIFPLDGIEPLNQREGMSSSSIIVIGSMEDGRKLGMEVSGGDVFTFTGVEKQPNRWKEEETTLVPKNQKTVAYNLGYLVINLLKDVNNPYFDSWPEEDE